MQKLLYASVVGLALGCGQVTPPLEKVSSLVSIPVAPEPVKAVMPPVQRTVTAYDAKGQPHQITVTEMVPAASAMRGEKAPLPKAKVDPLTLESVSADLDQALREMREVLTRGSNDERVKERCRPLIDRLKGVHERLYKPDCNLAHEQTEIRDIRDTLRRQTPKPRKTLPPPKEGKE